MFKKHLNSSPHRYLVDRRLSHSRSLLAGSGKSIKEIAFECGFDALENFYRSFKSSQSLTPAEYRRKYTAYK
ncbi:MAG: helix-turn-helix domain-containing protein [Lentisphaerae bacterium]|nr:helix-turn-helix domain-containing protein [Lentisphaerota bacterium]MCP4099955.1 helix-turn-helix domain-containing protein [Lentisphaerota bacterium]